MVIKNISCAGVPGFTGRKLDKTDAIKGKQDSDSDFAKKLNKTGTPAKVDTIEFSRRPLIATPVLSQVRDGILSDLNADKDVRFIEGLRAQVASGSYKTDPQEIAKSMLLGKTE